MRVFLGVLACVLGVVWCAQVGAQAEPEQRPDPTPEWLRFDAEYRVQSIYIDPLDLSGTEVTDVWWTEQRAVLDFAFKYKGIGGVYLKLDALDGVLFGDNGSFGGDPSPTSGLSLSSKRPNNAAWRVGLAPGADPLDTDSYIPVLRSTDEIDVIHAWGEVNLPIGVLRVGRMPTAEGAGIAAHDGGRRNRWGVSRFPEVSDRVLFATKLDEVYYAITEGPTHVPDPSIDNGVVLAQTFDWNTTDEIQLRTDDLLQHNTFLSWRVKEADLGGVTLRNFQVTQVLVHKFNKSFQTDVWAFPFRFEGILGPAAINFQISTIRGKTREISEGLSELSSTDTARRQDLAQLGMHFFFEYTLGPVALAFEFDYASGDADTRSSTPITSMSFARDFNVGLLLFEHLLAFQTARAAAVGIENLSQLDSESFPVTEIATDGRFTNAIALFPQVRVDWVDTDRHKLHTRFGFLVAWGEEEVVDPIRTAINEDGDTIEDDARNFHGGTPARFYGTEYDLQIEWTYENFFTWTIESAFFVPGEALEDRNGLAVPSFLFENRFVFTF